MFFLHRNDGELRYLCIWNVITLVWCTGDFETEQVLLLYRGEVWFLLVLWTSCNVLFSTSLRDHSGGIYLCMNVSGGVFDEVLSRSSLSKPAAFLAELTSVQTSSWCQRLCVLSGMQSSSGRDAGHR